ncbi:hypothetical protein EVAR_21065_1 [Eumeta japonica]|uniref:Uncharacterized protein n=1 Tax=Eumeta variegata TaxID=151549 RepID=A0A4C1UZX5_EUMVA|nr:hypothetical protein EVAR_21065_1 [Eumeta japonica]
MLVMHDSSHDDDFFLRTHENNGTSHDTPKATAERAVDDFRTERRIASAAVESTDSTCSRSRWVFVWASTRIESGTFRPDQHGLDRATAARRLEARTARTETKRSRGEAPESPPPIGTCIRWGVVIACPALWKGIRYLMKAKRQIHRPRRLKDHPCPQRCSRGRGWTRVSGDRRRAADDRRRAAGQRGELRLTVELTEAVAAVSGCTRAALSGRAMSPIAALLALAAAAAAAPRHVIGDLRICRTKDFNGSRARSKRRPRMRLRHSTAVHESIFAVPFRSDLQVSVPRGTTATLAEVRRTFPRNSGARRRGSGHCLRGTVTAAGSARRRPRRPMDISWNRARYTRVAREMTLLISG